MATVTGVGVWTAKSVHTKTWTPLHQNDVGTVHVAPQLPDKAVTINGTFGAGGSINIEGNSDGGSTYDLLHDVNGNVLTFTANGSKAIAENVTYIRPNCTAGDGTTSLTCIIVGTKPGG